MLTYRYDLIWEDFPKVQQKGEANKKFGVYRTLCCGAEIVINQGATFPDCPNHPKLTTTWKPVVDDKIIQLTNKKSPSQPCQLKSKDDHVYSFR
jgi:hypothetical protein